MTALYNVQMTKIIMLDEMKSRQNKKFQFKNCFLLMFLLLCELFFLFSEMEWVSFFAYALKTHRSVIIPMH